MRDWIVSIIVVFFGVCTHSQVRADCVRSPAESLQPGRLSQPKGAPSILCDRPFVYRGEVYSVDSPQAQDAANLKSFMRDVPEAEALLQTYQDRRERSRLSAYTGTVGILMIILANTVFKNRGTSEQQSLHSAFQIGGLALTAGGFIYSYSLLRTNELLIPDAVDRYNRAKPADPIELKFQAGWSF
ncbi:MAG: hypothetical protein KGP28_05255 [Bdellovibrionales bacterium]|nr:hypothetical protein [Bdellovibrionales bacterium]